MSYSIIHNEASTRYETEVEGYLCELNYVQTDSVMTMNRVYVPAPVEGRGIASALTQFALDDCDARGLSVIATCPYVFAWIKRHEEYQRLLHRADKTGDDAQT